LLLGLTSTYAKVKKQVADVGTVYELGFKQRANQIIVQTADVYTPPSPDIGDPEKYYWPKVMARFEKYGTKDTLGNRLIRLFAKNSPFHFILVL
jgi:hypothetical protein